MSANRRHVSCSNSRATPRHGFPILLSVYISSLPSDENDGQVTICCSSIWRSKMLQTCTADHLKTSLLDTGHHIGRSITGGVSCMLHLSANPGNGWNSPSLMASWASSGIITTYENITQPRRRTASPAGQLCRPQPRRPRRMIYGVPRDDAGHLTIRFPEAGDQASAGPARIREPPHQGPATALRHPRQVRQGSRHGRGHPGDVRD